MNSTRVFWLLLAILMLAAVALMWSDSNTTPTYSHSHDQAGHTHEHVHDGTTSHDHFHFGLVGRVSHSHPHVHPHVHEPLDEFELEEGLTEIHHVHKKDGLKVYWVKASVKDKTISVEFWTNKGGKLERAACDKSKLSGFLVVGGRAKQDILLTEESGSYVGKISDNTLLLPSNVLGLNPITIDDNKIQNIRTPLYFAEE